MNIEIILSISSGLAVINLFKKGSVFNLFKNRALAIEALHVTPLTLAPFFITYLILLDNDVNTSLK